MRRFAKSRWLTLLFGIAASSEGLAIEPGYAQWGPLYVQPLVEVDLAYTDNLYRRFEGERDSWILKTSPEVEAWLQNGPSKYGLLYRLQDFRYSNSEEKTDDFTDHLLDLDINHVFNGKNTLNVTGEYHRTHEERGTGLTQGYSSLLIDRPIEYDLSNLGGKYIFGNSATDARVEIAADFSRYDYQNFRDFTRFYDYERDTYRGTFYWNLSGKTSVLVEGRFMDVDYAEDFDPTLTYNSEETQLFVGGEWEASAKTRGRVRVGYYEREFESPFRETADGLSWEIGVTWRPKSYSIWDFNTQRLSRETNGVGNFINSEEYGARWVQDYRRGWRSIIEVIYARDEFTPDARNDDRVQALLQINRKLRRWMDVGIGYRYEERDSTRRIDGVPSLNYDKNTVFVELDVSL